MRFSPRAGEAKRRLFQFVAAITLTTILGCSQEPQPDDATATPPAPAIPDGDAGQVQATTTPPPAALPVSFGDYALPIPCRRTSDSRDATSGGAYKNVIVFNCRSHNVPSANQAIREHMIGNGYSLSDETASAGSTSIVARKPGRYKTTIRIVADKNDPTRSVVRVQWFSKD